MKGIVSDKLSSNSADLWIDDEGILWYEIHPGAQETLADVYVNLDNAVVLTGGKALPVLYDMRKMKGIDSDALQAYYHDERAILTTKAMAMVQESWLATTIANLVGFRFYAKAEYPAKSFREIDPAYQWLRQYL